ncbi:MAG TPA: LacI family transcriptional regulator [Romboutsia timonensis]|uniref:LacI family transcriptional regulator n=1 Tax=Romboutsia timonensis TaxID=1776391 RepID=A0A921N0N4_9FIRM|nr:LacI family transcriptional regulator [Romboutsia timonensis]
MKITIKDVAKEANVATSTVSRVLSNSPKISEKTKEKVHEAIKKLNYKPNAIARSLANNRTRILGVVLPEDADDILNNPFFINAMKGMSMYAQKKNYYITYAFSKTKDIENKNIKDIINSNLVDGVILLRVSENDKNIEYLKSIDFPFVVVGRPDNPEEVLWVNNDNTSAMYNVVEKLIKKGHRKIGFIGAIENLNMSKDRFIGYKNALYDYNIVYDKSIVIHKDEFIENEGQSACNEILQNKDITAIVTTDDLIAFGIMKELKLKNRDNISIVGFNNTPLSAYQNPPLATVDINAYELGYNAAKLLISNLEGNENAKKHYIVDTEFIERESFI